MFLETHELCILKMHIANIMKYNRKRNKNYALFPHHFQKNKDVIWNAFKCQSLRNVTITCFGFDDYQINYLELIIYFI